MWKTWSVSQRTGLWRLPALFTQEYLEEAWENQVAQVEKSYAFYEKSGADENAVKTAALSVQQHKQAHYEDMTATYVIDENQILRSIEYQITLIMPEITQDLSGNKMLGKRPQDADYGDGGSRPLQSGRDCQ